VVNANLTAANLNITTLQSNAASQALEINNLYANINSYLANVATSNANIAAANARIIIIDANLGSTSTNVTTLQSNAGTQATQIDLLNANVAAANINISTKANVNGDIFNGNIRANYILANSNVKITSTLEVGNSSPINYPGLGGVFVGNVNSYYQVVVQNLSNESFFHTKSNNTNFNYLGLKLNIELPTAQRLANTKNKSIQIKMLSNSEEHSIKENDIKNQQLILDYEKSLKQVENFKKIADLKKDTYEKNYNQFKENILSLDKLLISQNELLQSKLNLVLALASISFNKNKIDINNKF
jgi:hypothetical protein